MTERSTGWVSSATEKAEREAEAARLVGERIVAVRYVAFDDDEAWNCADADGLDFGVELETEAGRTFSAIWAPPGEYEGLSFRELPLIGRELRDDAVAVTDVTARSRWADVVDQPVTDVEIYWEPWDDAVLWCHAVAVAFGERRIFLTLNTSDLEPSATDVAVVFDEDVARRHAIGPYRRAPVVGSRLRRLFGRGAR
jgi:hypothetical protein